MNCLTVRISAIQRGVSFPSYSSVLHRLHCLQGQQWQAHPPPLRFECKRIWQFGRRWQSFHSPSRTVSWILWNQKPSCRSWVEEASSSGAGEQRVGGPKHCPENCCYCYPENIASSSPPPTLSESSCAVLPEPADSLMLMQMLMMIMVIEQGQVEV